MEEGRAVKGVMIAAPTNERVQFMSEESSREFIEEQQVGVAASRCGAERRTVRGRSEVGGGSRGTVRAKVSRWKPRGEAQPTGAGGATV